LTWDVTSRPFSRQLLALWLTVSCWLVACGSVLGIEDRRADVADSYPEQGYQGCRPGDCSGCLHVHRAQCEVLSACAQVDGQQSCAGCVCQSCADQLVACRQERGCADIWECLRETRCDLSESAAGSCLEECGAVVQANGGVSGSAWRTALGIRTCAASAACLGCLTPQVQQTARNCSQQNACQDCDDCFSQCLCSGERFGFCQDECGDDAPVTSCTEDDGCANCSSCFEACSCSGKSFQECGVLCSPSGEPGPEPVCTADTSCADCADCVSQCVCSGGGDQALCEVLCSPPAHDTKACEFDGDAGYSLCTDCTSCLASCTCNGTELSACMATCGHHDCCGSNNCSPGGATGCSCTSTADTCFQAIYGDCSSFSGCDTCACEQCPGALTLCLDTAGCKPVFDCMRTTECHGSACFERCGGGAASDAFAVAEALWACYHGSYCSCSTAPATLSCPSTLGNVQCAGYESASATLDACCTQTTSGGTQTEQVEILGDNNPCGLRLDSYFRDARACEPRDQANAPRFEGVETCEGMAVGGEIYHGATLRGCCHTADGTCGYFDDVTGLGCLSASIFGVTPQPCP
jgi:hypothetical protein